MTRPIIAWSYSALNDFKNCPYKYWAVRVGKIVSDVNAANAGGEDYHREFELYVNKGKPLAPNLQRFTPVLDKLKKQPGQMSTELQLALDVNYQPCGFKAWDLAWVRAVSDWSLINGTRAWVIDYKFGKPKKDQEQNALVAAVLMHTYPQIQEVTTNYWFALHDKWLPDHWRRQDIGDIWNMFLPDVNELAQAKLKDEWPKTPSPLCGWCPVKTCVHNTMDERLAREAAARSPD
jgi:hypothetical protein